MFESAELGNAIDKAGASWEDRPSRGPIRNPLCVRWLPGQVRPKRSPQSSRAVEWNYINEPLIGVDHLHLPSLPIVSCLFGLLQEFTHHLRRFTSGCILVDKLHAIVIFR